MQRDLEALVRDEHDLVVVGGGMFGAAAALDAAQRGLKVALIERSDFAGATSAHSFKMIHGGIRYLQHADVPRVRQSARARAAFLRTAPHLTQPLPIAVPTYGRFGLKSRLVLRAGMAAYDLLTFDRNQGILDPARRIPQACFMSRAEVRRRYPGLAASELTGAGIFHDGQMYNPPRLVLAFVQSAAEAGARCANHLEAVGLVRRRDRVEAVVARDRFTGQEIEVRGRIVLNAAGPYAERLLLASLGQGLASPTPFSRDAYFIIGRPLLEGDMALTLPSATSDPDAIVSRGTRHLFLVPWRGVTLVGVWHQVYHGDPDRYAIAEPELAAWLGEINGAYAGLDLSLDDVMLGSAGLVPFGENAPDSRHLRYAHRSRLIDHARERGLKGLLSLIGVRFTTAPVEAVEVIDLVVERLGIKAPPSCLETRPVRGGAFSSLAEVRASLVQQAPNGTAAASLEALARNHGSAAGEVLALTSTRPDLARTLGTTPVLAAEIVHAVRREMAVTLGDVAFRRTDLCTAGHPGEEALVEAARLMAEAGGWSAARRVAELDAIRRRLNLARSGRSFLDADAPGDPALVA